MCKLCVGHTFSFQFSTALIANSDSIYIEICSLASSDIQLCASDWLGIFHTKPKEINQVLC